MITSVILFIVLSPGIWFNWQGGSFVKGREKTSKRTVGMHAILYAMVYMCLALLFASTVRMWPGSQQVIYKYEPLGKQVR